MANILVRKTAGMDKDPFATSDRDFQGGAGKGDRDRSNISVFKRNYDFINWGRDKKKGAK